MNFIRIVKDARMVLKWNPDLALEMFKDAYAKAGCLMHIESYNEEVTEANKFLDQLESYRFYNKNDFWETTKPFRIPLITEEAISFDQQLQRTLYGR